MTHLLYGQLYDIQGKTFFTMGGGSSHDIDGGILEPDDPQFKRTCRMLNHSGALYQVNHRSWWEEELSSDVEYQTARASLERYGWKVDDVVTHCGPTSVQDELSGGIYKSDTLTDFLDEVAVSEPRFSSFFFEKRGPSFAQSVARSGI